MIVLLQQVTTWWIVFLILGFIALPITASLFGMFFDKGYIFSKIIGLILLSYLMFLLGTLHVLPFSWLSLMMLAGSVTIVSAFIGVKTNFLEKLKASWKFVIFEEVIFFVTLFFWSYIKSFQPDIHGLEKFMDYGFINSILRSTYFPPKDMWMAPLSINYYYFGHLMTAVATKLSLLPSYITFDLMLATIFAFTFTQGFSLGANLIYLLNKNFQISNIKYLISKPVFAGLLTAILLTFGGNLHTLYTLFTPYQNDSPVPPTSLTFSPQTFPNQYWYPNATRFIFHTIHEFPIYSFVVSDLHGHVLDIPIVLLIIAAIFVIFIKPIGNCDPSKKVVPLWWKLEIGNSLLLGSLTAVAYMTNAWDGLIYLGISVILIIFNTFKQKGRNNYLPFTIYYLLFLFLSFIFVGLPFSLFFKPFASQIGINCAPQFLLNLGHIGPVVFEPGYCQYSPLWQLAILWGFFFFWLVSFTAFLYRSKKNKQPIYPTDIFILAMGVFGFLLILIPEFVYLKDIYTTYFRANTMFKLVYQAFILLSLTSGYSIYRIISAMKQAKKSLIKSVLTTCYTLLAMCLITLVLIYPYFAIMSYFNNLKHFQGLNGITYLSSINADDYTAVKWINAHIQGQPVMLEAQGDSYTDYERISSNTGLPTVFGWMVHEWLWRGTYAIVPPRIADVTALYTSENVEQTKMLLQKYHVEYVYIGDMERTKYPKIDEEKFNQLGTIVYSSGSVKIYKIN